jgi:hypothetical protein
MKYSTKLQNLINRRGDNQYIQKSFSAESSSSIFSERALRAEKYYNIDFPDTVKYALVAMTEVEEEKKKNTFKEGERIKNQITDLKNSGFNISFEFQGSTTNNTHIKQHSDIDLLVLQENFLFNSPTASKYYGDWRKEQSSLRQSCYEKLKTIYNTATVDNNGKFAISITGGSLRRKIDVVPACWDMGNQQLTSYNEILKGVRVYTRDCGEFNLNYPFLNNELVEKKDNRCNGNYRKAVRLLKTLKGDSDRQIDISSYDIVALLFHMDDSKYHVNNQYLVLVKNITSYLISLTQNLAMFYYLEVPDGTRKICDKTTIESLNGIAIEVGELEKNLVQDLAQIRKSIQENFSIGKRIYS